MGRMIRGVLAALPLFVGALLVIGGGTCMVAGAFFPSLGMALSGLLGLLAGLGISYTVYRWATREEAPPPHDS